MRWSKLRRGVLQRSNKNASKRKTSTTNVSDDMRANPAAAIAFAAFYALFTMTPAAGVALNPRGLGQVLIFPYYTVNHGQDALFSIGNAGDSGKVVHLRFHESYNARTVLEFDVFLSAHDVWTAAITQTSGDGAALIRTSDRSCTNPPIAAAGQAFLEFGYTGPDQDSGPQTPARTRARAKATSRSSPPATRPRAMRSTRRSRTCRRANPAPAYPLATQPFCSPSHRRPRRCRTCSDRSRSSTSAKARSSATRRMH
jgi:hypothetical protein